MGAVTSPAAISLPNALSTSQATLANEIEGDGGKELLREKADLSPEQIYQKTIAADIADIHRIRAALLGADGKELVAYTPYRRNQKPVSYTHLDVYKRQSSRCF